MWNESFFSVPQLKRDPLDRPQREHQMPRIPESNPRFRSKAQICADLSRLLNLKVSWGTQHAALAEACWVWSEFEGKYAGCLRWSQKAAKTWKAHRTTKDLRHDHIVPKRLIISRLKKMLGTATPEKVKGVLEKWCMGAVITRDEDRTLTSLGLRSKMPDGWDRKNALARYQLASISLRSSDQVGRSNKRLKLTARVHYGMNRSSARRSLSAIR